MASELPKPDYYTVAQLAEILGKSSSTVRRWCRDGNIKARQFTPNGEYYIPRAIVSDLVKTEEEK